MLQSDDSIKEIIIFADEAGHETNRFLSYGIMICEKQHLQELWRAIESCVLKHNCRKQVLYKSMSGHLDSSRFKCAIDWLKKLNSKLPIYFSYLEIDSGHNQFDTNRFSMKHHKYHLFYKLSLKAILHKYYQRQKVKIKLVIHHRNDPTKVILDPYSKEEYLRRVINSFNLDVKDIDYIEMSCDHLSESNYQFARILQFLDVILGSTFNAVHQNSIKKGKMQVSQMASYFLHCNKEYSYRYSFSRFPDERGFFKPIQNTKIPPLMYDPPGANKILAEFF